MGFANKSQQRPMTPTRYVGTTLSIGHIILCTARFPARPMVEYERNPEVDDLAATLVEEFQREFGHWASSIE
jgi:hypothetical protein